MKIRKILAAVLALMMAVTVQLTSPLIANAAADPARNGLRGDYYIMNNQSYNFDRYMMTAVDANIDWMDTKTMLKQRSGADEYVTVRWSGWIKTPSGGTDGSYTFSTSTDDSLRLWVNNTQIINWWGNQWDANSNTWGHSGTITLSPDTYYPFTMEYSQGHGGAFARIRWQRTTGDAPFSWEVIPASAFYLDDGFRAPLIMAVDTAAITERKLVLNVTDFTENTKLNLFLASDTMQLNPIAVSYEVIADGKLSVNLPETIESDIYRLIAEDTVNGTLLRTASENFSTMLLEGTPRSEYPRPDYMRDDAWESLNGPWDFKFDRANTGTAAWAENGLPGPIQTIMVPFPWQSPASGIYDETNPGGIAWYQREITPSSEKYAGKRVFIRFGAVDAECWLYINGKPVGFTGDGVSHNGGYTPFEFDITEYVTLDQTNTITLKVRDLGSYGDNTYTALIGKQGRNAPCGYAGTSGIWQSVILEGRISNTQLDYVHVNPLVNNNNAVVDANNYDITNGVVPVDGTAKFKVNIVGGAGKTLDVAYNLKAVIWDDVLNDYRDARGASVISGTARVTVPAGSDAYLSEFTVNVPNQQLWSPDEPNLYVGTVTLKDGGAVVDTVDMYYGQRDFHNAYWSTSSGPSSNQRYQYTLLNNQPIFLAGLLDQGFWEEGVYTAPTEEALKYDIKAMREDGFNMIRKHLKIEDPLQYLWCDRLGMILWQDMPHATNMNTNGGQDGSGRPLFENALDDLIERDYNHPSLMAYILFNETWGINRNADTAAWVRSLYNHVKATDDSGRLVEEMSPCNNDHIQPTDMNTFHNYQGSWSGVRDTFNHRDNNTYIGSNNNFSDWTAANGGGNVQDGDPFYNSEYGGVGAYDGDWDISWCFKYQTDILRLRQKLQGYVYTEPYDIEYERNGLLTYDRRRKIMGYDEMAYGGDMTIKNLNQPEYIGFDKDPMVTLLPGDTYTATIGAIRWSDTHTGPFTVKWRVDGVDQFGNKVDTDALADAGFRGETTINYTPYVYETKTMSFTIPSESRFNRFAGTVTAWVVDGSGATIAKNFTNFKVMSPIASKASEEIADNAFILRQTTPTVNTNTGNFAGEKTGVLTYEYPIPADFDIDGLASLRLFAELSAAQKLSTSGNSSHRPQTAEGYETPSDVSVTVNGHAVGSVYIPDAPCDIRGVMSLNSGLPSQRDGFGYLVNLDIDEELIAILKDELAEDPTLTVSYTVLDTAENKNGIRAFNDTAGRYAVSPSVVLNPPELYSKTGPATDGALVFAEPLPSANFTVEANVSSSSAATIVAGYVIAINGSDITVTGNGANASATADGDINRIKVSFFEERVSVFVNDNPQPVIDVYGSAAADTDVSVAGALADVKVLPESYATRTAIRTGLNVQFVESFNTNNNWRWATTRGTWTRDTANSRMPFAGGSGTILYQTNLNIADAVVEFDMNFGGNNPSAGSNAGIVVRSQSDYNNSNDAANGIYIGIGRQHTGENKNTGTSGYIQIGRVAGHGWTELTRRRFAGSGLENFSNTATYHFKIVMVGPRYTVYINDVLIAEVYDSTFTSGSIALRNWNCNASGWYDNVVVSSAPVYSADFTERSLYGPNSNNASTTGMSGFNYSGVRLDEWQRFGSWTAEAEALSAEGESFALIGSDIWRDGSASVSLNLAADTAAGMLVRAIYTADGIEGYAIKADSADSTVALGTVKKGVFTPVETVTAAVVADTADTLKVTAVSNVISVYYNGSANPLISWMDNTYSTGKTGLVTFGGAAIFDDFVLDDKYTIVNNLYDGALDDFQIVGGAWTLEDQVLSVGTGTDNKAVFGNATIKDFELDFDYRFDSADTHNKNNGSVIFRATDFGTAQDQMKGYVLSLGTIDGAPLLELCDLRYGWRLLTDSTLAGIPDITANIGEWHHIKVKANGLNIQVYVNGELKLDYTDTEGAGAYYYGQVGFRNFHAGASFKNIVLKQADESEKQDGLILGTEVTADGLLVRLDNNTADDQRVNLIAAVYDSEGRLYDVANAVADANSGITVIRQLGVSVDAAAGQTYKVFVWDPVTYVPVAVVITE